MDRVRTSHGVGTVVEVDGDKYLVDLDGQEAKLWEKAWGLRKVEGHFEIQMAHVREYYSRHMQERVTARI